MGAYVDLRVRLYSRTRETPSGCLEFTGYLNNKGYGRINVGQVIKYAHRTAVFIETGKWPNGHVMHTCDAKKKAVTTP